MLFHDTVTVFKKSAWTAITESGHSSFIVFNDYPILASWGHLSGKKKDRKKWNIFSLGIPKPFSSYNKK